MTTKDVHTLRTSNFFFPLLGPISACLDPIPNSDPVPGPRKVCDFCRPSTGPPCASAQPRVGNRLVQPAFQCSLIIFLDKTYPNFHCSLLNIFRQAMRKKNLQKCFNFFFFQNKGACLEMR
jgi:hypothetical protein